MFVIALFIDYDMFFKFMLAVLRWKNKLYYLFVYYPFFLRMLACNAVVSSVKVFVVGVRWCQNTLSSDWSYNIVPAVFMNITERGLWYIFKVVGRCRPKSSDCCNSHTSWMSSRRSEQSCCCPNGFHADLHQKWRQHRYWQTAASTLSIDGVSYSGWVWRCPKVSGRTELQQVSTLFVYSDQVPTTLQSLPVSLSVSFSSSLSLSLLLCQKKKKRVRKGSVLDDLATPI